MERQVLRRSIWGWLPVLTVSAAFGVLVAAMAMIASINDSPYAMLMFWFGILCIVLPVALRLLNPGIQYAEALALVILAGGALFLVSTIRSSNQNSSFDSFLHYRTAVDILESRHLFTPNPMLPVSPY